MTIPLITKIENPEFTGLSEKNNVTLKTFIYTGNVCLHLVMPVALNLALGKRGVGHMIENAVTLYEKEGYK